MDLIIKPTEACNFACTFCSSSYLVENKRERLHLKQVFQFLERYPDTNTIIVNGGDPTMMPTDYYWDLIEHLDKIDSHANISMTTNLWKFWLEWKNDKPEKKWTELFKNPRVSVTTSFNYGDGRRISKDRVFTEEDFIKVSDLFLDKVGYRPHFISVITEDNIHSAIDNVRLARHLDVDCKLNYVNASGRAGKPLPLSRIYEVYIQIHREGLAAWEWNTRQMANRLTGMPTTCPLHRNCDEGIRVLQPDGKYYSCGAFGDDLEYEIDFQKEVIEKGKRQTPLQDDKSIDALKHECYSCPMFKICNGCRKHIVDLKRRDMVEEHCSKMKSIAADIEKVNFNHDDKFEVRNDTHIKGMGHERNKNRD
jgi:radical SAM protein with 4Fe4S-binding SPASM domain